MKKIKSSMGLSGRMDTRDIGLRIANIFGRHFLHTDHLHYGYWPADLPVKIENLPEAQDIYCKYLIDMIPDGVKTILDVGCGTGANAKNLIAAGYEVDCVSPSQIFMDEVEKRLGSCCNLYICCFQDLEIERKYDMILFSESLQYIPLDDAFKQTKRFLNDGGKILIADFFRIRASGQSPMGGGHRHERFLEYIEDQSLEVIFANDITAQTAPNIQLVHEALEEVAIPSVRLIQEILERNYKISYALLRFVGKVFFRKKISKLQYKYFSGERNPESFQKHKRYMCYLLRQKS